VKREEIEEENRKKNADAVQYICPATVELDNGRVGQRSSWTTVELDNGRVGQR
jgi:hypothetical protein